MTHCQSNLVTILGIGNIVWKKQLSFEACMCSCAAFE